MNILTRDLLAQLATPPAAIRDPSEGAEEEKETLAPPATEPTATDPTATEPTATPSSDEGQPPEPAPDEAAPAGFEPAAENAPENAPEDALEIGVEPDPPAPVSSDQTVGDDASPSPAPETAARPAAPAPQLRAPARPGAVTHEPDSGRRHIRIKMPIDVVIDGATYRAADWSLSGIKVEDIETGLAPGDVFAAELAVPFPGFRFSTAVSCELVYNDRERRCIGCRFVDLGEHQVELLRYLVDAYLSGRVATVDGLFRVAGGDAGGRRRGGGADPLELPLGQRIRRAVGLSVRYGLLLALGAGLVLAAGTAIHTRLLTVDAQYAAVAAPTIEMRAPAAGNVVGARLVPGARVAAGSTLFEVRNTALAGELAVARAGLRREEAALAVLRQKLGDRKAFFAEYMLLAEAALTKATAERQRARKALDIARRISERAAALRRKGAVAEQEAEEAQVTEARAELEFRVAQAAFAEAQSNLRLAREGYFFTGTRVEGGEPGDIERAIKLAERTVATARERVRALESRITETVVRSPCDCVVHAALVDPGEWIEGGYVAYVLREERAETVIEALVMQERADELEIGAIADVKLADRDAFIRATVVDVNRGQQYQRRAGLPEPYRTSTDYAVVLLAPEMPLDGVAIGLPAKVRLPSSRKTVLLDLFDRDVVGALAWLADGVAGWFGSLLAADDSGGGRPTGDAATDTRTG